MTGFPNLPLTRGETDDDASIHLYSQVGPTKPLLKSKYDHQILSILSNSHSKVNKHAKTRNVKELNKTFSDFIYNSHQLSDSESEETVFESQSIVGHEIEKLKGENDIPTSRHLPFRSLIIPKWISTLAGFILGGIIIILVLLWGKNTAIVNSPSDLSSVTSRLLKVEDNVQVLHNLTTALDSQVDLIEVKQTNFITALKNDLDQIENSLFECEKSVSVGQKQYQALLTEIVEFRSTLNGLQVLEESPIDLKERLSAISENLATLTNTSNSLQEVKTAITHDLLLKLPEHVPVYIKNHKIHYIPEFHNFLHAFVEKYSTNSSQDWKSFVEGHGQDFENYLQTLVKKSHIELIAKSEIEKMLNLRLNMLDDKLTSLYTDVSRRIDLGLNISKVDVADAGNRIVLENLLDIVGKGSIKVNYADYNLGSRILGFLTTTGKDSSRHKSFARTAFLGWYDYFSSHGLRSPKNAKHNANNVLIDGGDYWQCEAKWCSIGIRLPSPIILTDFILTNPSMGRPKDLELPTSISIYIKPRSKAQASQLEKLVGYSGESNVNKYLAKYYKVVDIKMDDELLVEHVKFPLSLIQMKVSVRDIFVKLESSRGHTGVYNIKAYGLTELNAHRYSQEFESLVDKLQYNTGSTKENSEEGYTLEDDEYL
ncbi:hypothetical protein METBIDRAFT_40496 [Metschnikowia bicuspidata var. bicuspidata NRRL YB-4993]|uniref:SUN domain-containing protein n=1 Tax=Metschnikowia bicuspidata var. bicuspidata NRRL YB-4993 TaxID=869754 RepID=A0A1A0HDR9_9ASCO|nr:hypothetical protein METBIDRAFT_40496 [Metschnikowia bicuspidata var. bicuspidata NRRL YB-4993]OBA22234.1 hypothetical protein METBIDRAFT_40496 [Metschnikowia bicuspidata var. bicuspidata NRRL YB-4993]